MDKKYYNALSKPAIVDIKSLDRKYSRVLQMMNIKLTSHRKHMDINNMGHHITSNEMVNKHWVPLLTERAKEDWNNSPIREPPLWPQFEIFIEKKSQACREQEILGVATHETQADEAPTHVQDAVQTITITLTARQSSVLNAAHGNAGTIITGYITNHKRKGRMETLTVTSAMRAIPMEVIQAQELNHKNGSSEELQNIYQT
jgi:hypothetical protein